MSTALDIDDVAAQSQYAKDQLDELREKLRDATADALRFRWLCAHPDWHFIERLCQEFVADSSMEFLVEFRRVIDARRAVELAAFEQHMTPEVPHDH
jgi:hypothetical protein